jgi:hypothetical protein
MLYWHNLQKKYFFLFNFKFSRPLGNFAKNLICLFWCCIETNSVSHICEKVTLKENIFDNY